MKAVLFDWDGTLVDSLEALFAANVAVMGAFGLPFDEELYRRHFAPDWRVMYERLGVPAARLEEANAMWVEAYASGRQTSLLPGARAALERLVRAGFRLGLVTAGHREIVEPQLARLGVGRFFDVAVFGTDMIQQKPDPGPLLAALAGIATVDDRPVQPAETVYLGDTVPDVTMALAAGAHPIGIPSRIGSADELRAAGAEVIVESVAAWVDGILPEAPVMAADGRGAEASRKPALG